MAKKEKYLNVRSYLTLSAIIVFLLIMMFIIIDLEGFVRKQGAVSGQEQTQPPTTETGAQELVRPDLLEDLLLIEGKDVKTQADWDALAESTSEKKALIFLSLPTDAVIEDLELEELLGITKLKEKQQQKELQIIAGFLIGGPYQIKKLAYPSLNIELGFSTKVYAYSEKKDGDKLPVIWRNTYNNQEVYVVNGPFMESNASYGILSAIMAQINDDYIYPVVNSRLMVYENFPYLSYKNTAELERNYNRDAMKLQHDILFPNILTINKRRGLIPNAFFRAGFQEKLQQIPPHNERELISYHEQITDAGGEIGLTVSETAAKDERIYREVFQDQAVTSLFIRQEETDLPKLLEDFSAVEAVFGPSQPELNLQYLNEEVVYIPFTLEGLKPAAQEELDFLAMVTAYGMLVQNLNMEEIIQSEDGEENWTGGQKSYIKFIDQYRERFNFLKERNLTGTAGAVKIYLNQSPQIQQTADKIELQDANQSKDSSYILRTDKKISRITNARSKEIDADAYLIEATGGKIEISLSAE